MAMKIMAEIKMVIMKAMSMSMVIMMVAIKIK